MHRQKMAATGAVGKNRKHKRRRKIATRKAEVVCGEGRQLTIKCRRLIKLNLNKIKTFKKVLLSVDLPFQQPKLKQRELPNVNNSLKKTRRI